VMIKKGIILPAQTFKKKRGVKCDQNNSYSIRSSLGRSPYQ
jgi:hypothetical protein